MAKAIKKISWQQVALIVGAGFAWTKLGLGVAVKDVGVFRKEYPPKSEIGHLTYTEFSTKFPAASRLDYEDWLKGQ